MLLAFDDDYDTQVAMAEAPHGTAPALQGKDVANPMAMILACGAVLHYAGDARPRGRRARLAGDLRGVLEATAAGVRTPDLGGHAGTTEFTDDVVERVRTQDRRLVVAGLDRLSRATATASGSAPDRRRPLRPDRSTCPANPRVSAPQRLRRAHRAPRIERDVDRRFVQADGAIVASASRARRCSAARRATRRAVRPAAGARHRSRTLRPAVAAALGRRRELGRAIPVPAERAARAERLTALAA